MDVRSLSKVTKAAKAAFVYTSRQNVSPDYRLRDNDTGVQAIRRIQQEWGSDIPALIVTGDTAPDRLREVSASGYQLLHKPIPPARLRTFLNNVKAGRPIKPLEQIKGSE